MKESVKNEWVKALRRGLPQTKRRLRDNDGYCCLGVLCEVATQSGIDLELEKDDLRNGMVGYNGSYSTLPQEVIFWAGMKNDNPGTNYPIELEDGESDIIYSLAEMNDAGLDFDEIADYIERNWETM